MCIDYRALNKITIRNNYPILRIDDLLDKLSHARVFSKVDLDAAYHQLKIRETNISKTAFSTPWGHYEFLVLTFGFTNAPVSWQSLMNDVLWPFLDDFVIVYIDDILIFSQSMEEHTRHLQLVLEKLGEHRLHAKLAKCHFTVDEVEYLGYVVGHGTV